MKPFWETSIGQDCISNKQLISPMKTRLPTLLSLLLIWAGFAQAAGSAPTRHAADSRINVQFVEPEKYTDLRETWSGPSDSYPAARRGRLARGFAPEHLGDGH
jgi:hypothetical protein